MGIPKELRINKSKDFSLIRQQGLRRIYPHFIAQLKLDDSVLTGAVTETEEVASTQVTDPGILTRLGVIASRRVGNAVVRNRGKRIVRRLFYKYKHHLPTGSQLVIVLRLGIDKASFAQLEADFLEACLWYQKYPKKYLRKG